MDLRPHIERFARRLAEVESALSGPGVFDHAQRAQELSREYARIKDLVATGNAYLRAVTELADNRELLKTELPDSEMGQLAREEATRLEAEEKHHVLAVRMTLHDLTHAQAGVTGDRLQIGAELAAVLHRDVDFATGCGYVAYRVPGCLQLAHECFAVGFERIEYECQIVHARHNLQHMRPLPRSLGGSPHAPLAVQRGRRRGFAD